MLGLADLLELLGVAPCRTGALTERVEVRVSGVRLRYWLRSFLARPVPGRCSV